MAPTAKADPPARRGGLRGGARLAPLALALALGAGCASVRPAAERPAAPARPKTARAPAARTFVGVASFYADSLAGRPTASGEPYDPGRATCAHRRLPFGTRLEIEVLDTGRRARCRVNDRGPFVRGRVVDVSRAVATRLGLLDRGVAKVRVRVLP